MKKIYNICFEYQLRNRDTSFFVDLINTEKYENFNNDLMNSLEQWYLRLDQTSLYYKEIFIPDIIKYEIFARSALELQCIFFLFSFSPDMIVFHISKNFIVPQSIINILKSFNISYQIIKEDIVLHEITKAYSITQKDSFWKNLIRFFYKAINNMTKRGGAPRVYFQSYHSTKKLVQGLDEHYVSDLFPRSFYSILSKNSFIYFNPALLNITFSSPFDLNFKLERESISEVLNTIVQIYFKINYDTLCTMIDNIILNFNRFQVKDAVINSELPIVNRIIAQYIKNISGGSVYLLNHGVRSFSKKLYHEKFINFDKVLCWSDFEHRQYQKINKNLDLIKFGYQEFPKNKRAKTVHLMDKEKESRIVILPDMHFQYWDINYAKSLDDLVALIATLKLNGYQNISIKLHPGHMNKRFFADILKDYISTDSIFMYEPIHEILIEKDVVIGPLSTAFYDAIYMNVPYVVYANNQTKFSNNILENFSLPIFARDDLEKLVDYLKNKKPINSERLRKHLLYTDKTESLIQYFRREL